MVQSIVKGIVNDDSREYSTAYKIKYNTEYGSQFISHYTTEYISKYSTMYGSDYSTKYSIEYSRVQYRIYYIGRGDFSQLGRQPSPKSCQFYSGTTYSSSVVCVPAVAPLCSAPLDSPQ